MALGVVARRHRIAAVVPGYVLLLLLANFLKGASPVLGFLASRGGVLKLTLTSTPLWSGFPSVDTDCPDRRGVETE